MVSLRPHPKRPGKSGAFVSPAPTTLLALMRAATWRIGLFSVLSVGLVLAAAASLMLHLSTVRNLELQARSLAYSVEAAVMFQDREAVESLLQDLLRHEPVSAARVHLGAASLRDSGPAQDFAAYRKPGSEQGWGAAAEALWPVRAEVPVQAQGRVLAMVQLQADASAMLQLLAWIAGGVLLAMVLSGLAVMQISRRFADRLAMPLQALAEHTQLMRQVRPAGRAPLPAPRAGVVELDQLSSDFDALLQDLSAHQLRLLSEHDALRHAHARLNDQASRDSLTGVASRAHFEAMLARQLEQAQREDGGFLLYFVDADHFKEINDAHGHEAGDCVLIALAQRLRRSVRAEDLVGRLGGDEFVVLVKGRYPGSTAQQIAEHLRTAVAEVVHLPNGLTVIPGISVGLAVYPEHGRTSTELMKAADLDMYEHKRASRSPATGTNAAPSTTRSELETDPAPKRLPS
ncbi:sensor domain-containing diguanylate cyclase [Paucibacter sp. Y2R2-4]|uniref:sensor domain-containing diguanylate cyclase n=1 Tax=Paucibacter sp. Y2R2-4 TaxID=2893553 RepID=UPI0021E482C4|nr:sensor domain-containing diguanylate cyclase [Paucibacter sp. Y2R2-4]MCV2352464.1 diguanylate cyclase [Paucibacter sp. Y2R2-4]